MKTHKWRYRSTPWGRTCVRCGVSQRMEKRLSTRGTCGYVNDTWTTWPDGRDERTDKAGPCR